MRCVDPLVQPPASRARPGDHGSYVSPTPPSPRRGLNPGETHRMPSKSGAVLPSCMTPSTPAPSHCSEPVPACSILALRLPRSGTAIAFENVAERPLRNHLSVAAGLGRGHAEARPLSSGWDGRRRCRRSRMLAGYPASAAPVPRLPGRWGNIALLLRRLVGRAKPRACLTWRASATCRMRSAYEP